MIGEAIGNIGRGAASLAEPLLQKLPGFGANIARRSALESINIPAPFQAAIKKDPILEEPIRNLIAAYISGDNKLALAITNPMITNDPVVHSIGKTLYGAQQDRDHKLVQWSAKLLEDVLPAVGGTKTAMDLEFNQALRGFKQSSSPAIQTLLGKRQAWLQGLAQDTEDPALAAWSQHSTDADALYDGFRKVFHVSPGMDQGVSGPAGMFKPYEALENDWHLHYTKGEYNQILNIFARKVSFKDLSEGEVTAFKEKLLNRFTYPGAVPSDLSKRVPDFFANQYLLKSGSRTLEDSGVRELQTELFHYQHRASTERISKVLQPLINLLPGRQGALGRLIPSRRQYTQDMMDQFVSNAKTGDEQMLSRVFEAANKQLLNPLLMAAGVDARDPLTVSRARNLTGAILRGEYRGFLSVDTAFLDMALGLNTWAETGTFTRPFLQAIRGINFKGEIAGIPNHLMHEKMGYLLEANQMQQWGLLKTPMEKFRHLDQKLTDFVLHPMLWMHNLQRGTAYLAGVQRAINNGVDGTMAHRAGLASASGIVEDLMLTRAQMSAMETMARTTFGFTKVETPPIIQGPLGRISFMFMNWANNQAQTIAHGIGRAYGDADTEGLLRYTALLGFHTALPSYVAWAGLDITKFVIGGDLSHFTVPFWRQLTDGIYATTGEFDKIVGKTPSIQDVRAIERTKETFKGALIPQYRAGKEVASSFEALKTGMKMDDQNRLWYYTSPMGEMLRVLGVRPSEIKTSREAIEELKARTAIYYHEKQQAIIGLMQGDPSGVEGFQNKYGQPITIGDVQKWQQENSQDPVTRQKKRTPKAIMENIP